MHVNVFSNRWPRVTATLLAGLLLTDFALFALLPLDTLCPTLPGDHGKPVTVAAILFNGFSQDRTGINAETKRRLQHGLDILRKKQAGYLLVAGGNRPDKSANGARLMARYLREQGVDAQKIIVEDKSLDSISNLDRIRDILRKQGLEQPAGLVSSSHHLLRIRALGKSGTAGFRFLPYPATESEPPLRRGEIWLSAHSNLAVWLANVLLPAPVYKQVVLWVRTNTDL